MEFKVIMNNQIEKQLKSVPVKTSRHLFLLKAITM